MSPLLQERLTLLLAQRDVLETLVTAQSRRHAKIKERLLAIERNITHANIPAASETDTSSAFVENDVDLATKALMNLNIPFTSFSHPPAATVDAWRPYVEQHAKPGSKICKNLFLKDKKGKLVLCTALSETNTDLKYLQEKLKVRNPRLAASTILSTTLGLKSGAVTPLSCIADPENKVIFVLDKAMLDAGESAPLLFHPLSGNECTVGIDTTSLLKYFKYAGCTPVVIEFPSREP